MQLQNSNLKTLLIPSYIYVPYVFKKLILQLNKGIDYGDQRSQVVGCHRSTRYIVYNTEDRSVFTPLLKSKLT